MGTQKTMPVDEPDNIVVTPRQSDGRSYGDALETWQSGHSASMTVTRKIRETREFGISGK
jgi:hypothetical protein